MVSFRHEQKEKSLGENFRMNLNGLQSNGKKKYTESGKSTSNGRKTGGNSISERLSKADSIGAMSNMVKNSLLFLKEQQSQLPTLQGKTEHWLAVISQQER